MFEGALREYLFGLLISCKRFGEGDEVYFAIGVFKDINGIYFHVVTVTEKTVLSRVNFRREYDGRRNHIYVWRHDQKQKPSATL